MELKFLSSRLNQPARSLSRLCFIFFSLFVFVFSSQLSASGDDRLHKLQGQIKRQSQQLEKQKEKREALFGELRSAEQEIAKVAKVLRMTRQELNRTREELADAKQQQAELTELYGHQQSALQAQLTSAYMSGNHDYIKLLMNQQEPGKIERTLSYYQYLNQARMDNLEALKKTRRQLARVERKLAEQASRLQSLERRQADEKSKMEERQLARERTLGKLKGSLSGGRQQLITLQENERTVRSMIERRRQREALEMDGLKALKGKLSWPVNGRISRNFGSKRQGNIVWKGVMLRAKEGQDVLTVHQGVVVYADWLKGFGLLMVVDHGDGYMSLYGHNQALLKRVGDRVESGEPIALAGKSGGRTSAGLYFEIRHQGRALDPSAWCRRS
ncbi:murein hydrolase activator EnvC family protein [Corallincola platygyrae]|uniref:Murein hydrolase activator EnvC family protein n=1 Tax=Corallincola platygyrae TaxID=1193278 RepID=A0ABW4XRH7_9GAMM